MSDIRTLDFNLLKAFVVLLDECNVSRAAQRLSITQPAMSGILNRLRESFNDPLFVRVQHGMQPTDRALQLGQTARNILQDISSMLQPPILEPEHLNMTLRIAAMDYVQQIIALPLILRLRRLAPNVKVALLPVQGQNIKTLFEQKKINLALVSRQHLSTDTLKTVLYEERYVCAMSKTHPMAQTPLSLESILQSSLRNAFLQRRRIQRSYGFSVTKDRTTAQSNGLGKPYFPAAPAATRFRLSRSIARTLSKNLTQCLFTTSAYRGRRLHHDDGLARRTEQDTAH